MLARLASGFILAAVVSAGVIYLPSFWLKAIICILVVIGCYEASRMLLPRVESSSVLLPIFLGTALSVLIMYGPGQSELLLLAIFSIFLITFSFYLFRQPNFDLVLGQVARTIFAVLYIGLLLSFLGLLRDLPEGWPWLLLALSCTFAGDTGAYFAGRYLGSHLLAPKVSPKKTIEGLLGGVAGSVLAAFVFKLWIFKDLTTIDCLWVGGIAGFIGPLGDLAESLMKRSVGVKDSGNLIPGHGGLLDRVDALLFTSPMIYWYALYVR